ncbi:MAG: hypothetical protein VYD50_04335, partial [Candidatus Thermoplasmatota archaeon]|nr:hypothetical protein [Candidatus Thermoplasmatota archaeon]
MPRHRIGNSRIISLSLPEELARRLDSRVGKGHKRGRSATIAKMIEDSLSGESGSERPTTIVEPIRAKT